jgi:hypothetical protein
MMVILSLVESMSFEGRGQHCFSNVESSCSKRIRSILNLWNAQINLIAIASRNEKDLLLLLLLRVKALIKVYLKLLHVTSWADVDPPTLAVIVNAMKDIKSTLNGISSPDYSC